MSAVTESGPRTSGRKPAVLILWILAALFLLLAIMYLAVPAKDTVWISAQGRKHRLSTATGKTACGLSFKPPFPGCNRTDPMCKDCTSRR